MALLDDVRTALRVVSTAMDSEIEALVAAALADMARVGVRESLIDEDDPDPLVRMAVMLYCKARFGYDNDEAARFEESYRQIVADMLNSPTSYGPEPQDDDGGEEES